MKKTLTVILALMFGSAALADDAKRADAPKADASKSAKAKLTADELQVMAHYRMVNLMEIDLGKAAEQKAARADVKAYGAMLVKDHSESNQKLMALAKQTGQKIPAVKPANAAEQQEHADAKAKAKQLKKLTGAAFDRQYLSMMVADHERELAKIDAKIAQVKNTELADMLTAKKPVLQHHADEARELQKNEAQAMK